MGVIARDVEFDDRLLVDAAIPPAIREQYGRLAASLHDAHRAGLAVLMVASALPGEGKTVTAVNLALTFSEAYRQRVLLVDADLRRPTIHRFFGVDNSDGLCGMLTAPKEHLPIQRVTRRLFVIPAGPATSSPVASLTSPRLPRMFTAARRVFDWIVVDTPPVELLPDARLVAATVDGAVLVVRAASTEYDIVSRAIEAIGRNRIAGVVLNGADPASADANGRHAPEWQG